MRRGFGQAHPPIPGHSFGNVNEQGLRRWEFGVGVEYVDDLFGIVACRSCIPERKRGDAVGVDVLGCALELGEGGKRRPCLVRLGVVYLQQNSLSDCTMSGPSPKPIFRYSFMRRIFLEASYCSNG